VQRRPGRPKPAYLGQRGFGHQAARRDWLQQRSNAVGQYLGHNDAATPVAGEPHRPAASMA